MKTKILVLLFALSFLFLQNINAQVAMLKATGILIPYGNSGIVIFDGAIEFKIKKQFTGQVSFGYSKSANYTYNREKTIITPQLRYYFKKDAWMQSPYIGLVFQQNTGKKDVFDDSDYVDFIYTSFTKFGVGLMLGKHFKVRKRLGIDVHLGVLREKGDLTIKVVESSRLHTVPKNYSYMENGAVNNRFFAGFNFYIPIEGPQTTTKKITKNTEGSL